MLNPLRELQKKRKKNSAAGREALKAVLDERANRCREEVDTVLKKHNCTLDVTMLITMGGAIPNVKVVALNGN